MDAALRVAWVDCQLELAAVRELDDVEAAKGARGLAAAARRFAQRTPEGPVPGGELRWSDESALWPALKTSERTIRALDALPPDLVVIDIDSRLSDLSALAEHAATLEILRVGLAAGVDLAPLRRCEALQRVRLEGDASFDDPVLIELEARGVAVDRPIDRRAATRPFKDAMLKLAVLEALHQSGASPLPSTPPAIYPQRFDEGNLDRLLALAIEPDTLAVIDELSWHGAGHEVCQIVFEDWTGEDDTFCLRDLAGIDALTGLERLRVRPLALLPKKQIAALAKRGVDIEDLDAVPPPREIVITYRPSDLPAEMTKSLPAQAGPRQCLFFIAVADSPAIVALFDNLPEPDIDHVDEGMALSDRVLRALHRSGELLGLLGVGVSDDCDTPYSSGFHAADADEVEAFLRERGCDLVPVTDLLPGATR